MASSENDQPPTKPRRRSSRSNSISSFLSSVKLRISLGGNENQWTCDYCTFRNKNHDYLSCEMCGMVRPPPYESIEEKPVGSSSTQEFELQSKMMSEEIRRREMESERKLIEERMREVIETQRQLYSKLEEKRVCRNSLGDLRKADQSIRIIQKEMEEQDEEKADLRVEMPVVESKYHDSNGLRQSGNRNQPKNNSIVDKTGSQENVNRERRRSSLFGRRPKQQVFQNPVDTMEINPWEGKSIGMTEILKCQEELWDRVWTDKPSSPSAGASHSRETPARNRFSLFSPRSKTT